MTNTTSLTTDTSIDLIKQLANQMPLNIIMVTEVNDHIAQNKLPEALNVMLDLMSETPEVYEQNELLIYNIKQSF